MHFAVHRRLCDQRQVVFKYTEALALDLRVFAKHGKRAVVGVDDVKCVARKDPKMVRACWLFSCVEFFFCSCLVVRRSLCVCDQYDRVFSPAIDRMG